METRAILPAPTKVTNVGFLPAIILGATNKIKMPMLTAKPTIEVSPREAAKNYSQN